MISVCLGDSNQKHETRLRQNRWRCHLRRGFSALPSILRVNFFGADGLQLWPDNCPRKIKIKVKWKLQIRYYSNLRKGSNKGHFKSFYCSFFEGYGGKLLRKVKLWDKYRAITVINRPTGNVILVSR